MPCLVRACTSRRPPCSRSVAERLESLLPFHLHSPRRVHHVPPKIRPRTVRLHPFRPDVAARLRHFHRPCRGAGGPLPRPVGLGLADSVACCPSRRAGGGAGPPP